VVIDGNEIVSLAGKRSHCLVGAVRGVNIEAAPIERALNETPEAGVIVDVKNAARLVQAEGSGSGTWITARNSPSWRMASAKLS
jgi:hypothetical protein